MTSDPPDKPLLHARRGPGRPRKHPWPEEAPRPAPHLPASVSKGLQLDFAPTLRV
jgi:hypothetical protein